MGVKDKFTDGDINWALSQLYRAIDKNIPLSHLKYTKQWEDDLDLDLTAADWLLTWQTVVKPDACLQYRSNAFKIML